jgi:hypothetical protein
MRIFGLAMAGVLAITAPIAAHANGPGSNMRPATAGPVPGIVLVWDGGGSGGHLGAIGGHPTATRSRQWNGGGAPPHWGRTAVLSAGVRMTGRAFLRTGSGVPAVALSIIRSLLIGEARQAGGVIRSRWAKTPAVNHAIGLLPPL